MTTLQAGPRKAASFWNGELGIWQDRPESIPSWIWRALHVARQSDQGRPIDDLEVVASYNTYQELLMELPDGNPLGIDKPQIFGAKFTVQHGLPVPFEVRWRSREERALQSLLDQL